MKKAAFSLLAIFVAATAHAGGFGGPPPFTNGSPLPTGVDGSYQASARGNNLTGVFRFTYSGGNQTTDPSLDATGSFVDPYNDYVFFVDGLVYRGPVQANINVGAITGVLDNGGVNIPSFFGNTTPGPLIAIIMSGYFNGKGDNNSPIFAFKGTGLVKTSVYTTSSNSWAPTGDSYKFKFTGVRNSINSTN